jgi:hypothetical protein
METQKERIENLKQQLLKARDTTTKKNNKELNEVRSLISYACTFLAFASTVSASAGAIAV